jgi:hypothetical protein
MLSTVYPAIFRRTLVLIKSRHTFLKLCALRFMRKVIALKDEFYNRYIIRVGVAGSTHISHRSIIRMSLYIRICHSRTNQPGDNVNNWECL